MVKKVIKKKPVTKAAKPKTRKTSKPSTNITTRSVAFKTVNLDGLKAHPVCKDENLSVSWVINRLVSKFLSGEVVLK